MSDDRGGKVVTFYSYKGGVGRTMALANVAWILAANGKRVLVVDWDLESPGLARFFHPFLDPRALESTGGVTDLILEFQQAVMSETGRAKDWVRRHASVRRYSVSIDWPHFPSGAGLDFLGAGQTSTDYGIQVGSLPWDEFYGKLGGGKFFDELRADMKRRYDYTLIDSRTGLGDVSSICTIHLPDTVVDCFTLSDQSINGAATIARGIRNRKSHRRDLRILPVQTRIDRSAEKDRAEFGTAQARLRFQGLPEGMSTTERDSYWATMQVPYQAYYNYEEILAVFGDPPHQRGTVLAAYEQLTKYVTDGAVTKLPPIPEQLRERTKLRFLRRAPIVEDEIVLRHAPVDQVWAEWIAYVLGAAGIKVHGPADQPVPAGSPGDVVGRPLTIVSRVNVGDVLAGTDPLDRTAWTPLLIAVDGNLPVLARGAGDSVSIAGATATEAVERVLSLVGREEQKVSVDGGPAPRYPGEQTTIFNVPAANMRFTGRERDLREVRLSLLGSGNVVLGQSPVALHGLGGVGKTQIATEYAHRFRSAYDVVWWIDAESPDLIDTSLFDLGQLLGLSLPSSSPATAQRLVLQALSRRKPYARWLLIFDNAEDPAEMSQFLPEGGGHVLVTSRDPAWAERAQPIQVDVFTRDESIEHIRLRVPSISEEGARQVAEGLGDLPIAVVAAAALLAESGVSVEEYVKQLRERGAASLVSAVWDVSLARLKQTSPAAYRFLQLLAVFGPGIAFELAYSPTAVPELTKMDPTASERLVRAGLIQMINRLALLKVDLRSEVGAAAASGGVAPGGEIVIHRVLQQVIQATMNKRELARARHLAHLALAAARPDEGVDDPDSWPRFRSLWPHLDVTEVATCEQAAVRELMIDRVRFLWQAGDYKLGIQVADRVDSTWTVMLAEMPDSPRAVTLRRQLLYLRFNKANILRDLGDFEGSLELDRAVLADQHGLPLSNHPQTLMTRGGIGGDLRALGRYAEALEQDEQTHALWVGSLGNEHPRTLAALNNLAVSHRLMGNFSEALSIDTEVWRLRRLVLGETKPLTLASLGNVGRDLRELGDYDRSIEILTEVQQRFLDTAGQDARHTLVAGANLAASLRNAGRVEEARDIVQQAYTRLHDLFGETNPETQACRIIRALAVLAVGEAAEARRELAELYDLYAQQLGATHPRALVCVNNLAMADRALADKQSAVRLCRIAADGLATRLGPEHPHTLAALGNGAICEAEAGGVRGALTMLENVRDRVIAVLGRDHPDAFRCEANIALARRELRRDGGGREVAEVARLLSARLGPATPAALALMEGRYLVRVLDPHQF